ncbi:MAG TPA: hypothetical protein PKL08_15595, partial [Thermoanaerobaculaceae bacterium]|nr:hypothetical protein [Thermoanaerobaculaceae bacterium]
MATRLDPPLCPGPHARLSMQGQSGLRRACVGGLTLLLALCCLGVVPAHAGSSVSPAQPPIVADHPLQPAASASAL